MNYGGILSSLESHGALDSSSQQFSPYSCALGNCAIYPEDDDAHSFSYTGRSEDKLYVTTASQRFPSKFDTACRFQMSGTSFTRLCVTHDLFLLVMHQLTSSSLSANNHHASRPIQTCTSWLHHTTSPRVSCSVL
jgi:hypothetical protein